MFTVFTEVAVAELTGERVHRHQFEERGEAFRWAKIHRSERNVVNVWVEDATGRVVDGVVSVKYVVVWSDGSKTFRKEFDTPEWANWHAERVWHKSETCKLTTDTLV